MSAETEHRQIVFRLQPRVTGAGTEACFGCRRMSLRVERDARSAGSTLHDREDVWVEAAVSVVFHGSARRSRSCAALRRGFRTCPYAPVRYTLKHQADAWQRYFKGQARKPKFKRRGNDSVTLPHDVRIEGDRLRFPRIGWMRLSRRGGDPYAHARPVNATVKRVCGKWYATVCYAVSAHAADRTAAAGIADGGPHSPSPDVAARAAAQKRAVTLNPIPCSGGVSSFALSRRRASSDSSSDPGPEPVRVRRQPRL